MAGAFQERRGKREHDHYFPPTQVSMIRYASARATIRPSKLSRPHRYHLIGPATHRASRLAKVASVHSATYAARMPIGDGLGLRDIERETARGYLWRKRNGGEDRRRERQTYD
jgi:hypothetical protein